MNAEILTCSTCGAAPGQECDRPTRLPHAARKWAALAAEACGPFNPRAAITAQGEWKAEERRRERREKARQARKESA